MAEAEAGSSRHIKRQERHELLYRLQGWLDWPLTILAFVMLGLLLADFTLSLGPFWSRQVQQGETAIWVIFFVAWAIQFALAPDKTTYLRRHWLTTISVLLPAFSAVRILRIARVLREASLVRVLTTLNRGARALGSIARRGELNYVFGLSLLVTLTGAGAAYYFEQAAPAASINTPADAIWWSFTLITTMNTGFEPVTFEGRVIGVLMRIFALAVSGYVTAVIAAHLLGLTDVPEQSDTAREVRLLREEVARLTERLHQQPLPAAARRVADPEGGGNRVNGSGERARQTGSIPEERRRGGND